MKFTSIVLALAVAANQFSSTFAAVVAKGDSETTSDGASITFNVLTNDLDNNGDPYLAGVVAASSGDEIDPASVIISKTTSGAGAGALAFVVADAGSTVDATVTQNGDGTITYTPTLGQTGATTFYYSIDSVTGGEDSAAYAAVTVTVGAATLQVFSNPFAISSTTAPKLTQNGLRNGVGLTFGAPSQLGLDGILNPVTDIDSSDTFLSNSSPGVQQFNRGQSFTDFFCNMPWSNCNN
jgi:hypothetical protein